MKRIATASAAILALGAAFAKTMGDEGKLPATKSMGEQVPAMKP